MLSGEGYKMFRGTMLITPKNKAYPAHTLAGDWLYKPEYDCWYCHSQSFPANTCEIVEDKTDIGPTRHGKWEFLKTFGFDNIYKCSECGRLLHTSKAHPEEDFPYCHCGAKMDGGTDNGAD